MAELGGAVLGFAVSKLLEEVLGALKHLKNGPKNLLRLQNLLERSQQSVRQLCSSVQDESHPAHKWLTELHKELQRSQDLVNGSADVQKNIVKRYLTSKESLEVYANVQALLQEASVHQWAYGMPNLIVFSDSDAKLLVDIRTTLERVEGLQKLADLSSKGPDILSTTSKLEQVFNSQSSGELSSSSTSTEACGVDSACTVQKPQVSFGEEDVAEKLINHLLNEEQRKWVGLWGMGGIGKSFTARKVFHDPRVQRHFSGDRLWLTVSKDQMDPKNLLKQLHEKLEGPNSGSQLPDDLEAAQFYLKSRLDLERVLLVLDDVWCDEMLAYLDVIPESKKGIILVTTRDQQIFRKVISFVEIFEVPRLSPEDSWKLFCFYAFRGHGGVVPLEVEAVAKEMTEECGQLPLALEVIGSTMADKELVPAEKLAGQSTLRVWERSLVQLKDANSAKNEYHALYLKLQLSVENLSAHDSRLLDCFSYFAAYPEDSIIETRVLVRMWIAEGLVQDDVKSFFSAEEEARILLGALVAKAMIEMRSDGEYCGIHDVLRDVALHNLTWNSSKGVEIEALARECLYAPDLHVEKLPQEWMVSATPFSAKRLSLQGNGLEQFPDSEQFDAPHLQVLILSNNPHLDSLSPRFFEKLSKLKVLDLGHTCIKRIPSKLLRRLKSLVLLDLSWCGELEEVSDYINSLQSLEFLDLSFCSSLQKLPQVKNLTKLTMFYADVPREEKMDIWDGSGPWQSCSSWLMHCGCSNRVVPYVLPPNLRQLMLYFQHSSKYLFDMSSLNVLEELKILNIEAMQPSTQHNMQSILASVMQHHQLKLLALPLGYAKPLRDLSTLPVLEHLSTSWGHDDDMESLGDEGAFPSLKVLRIKCERRLAKITFLPGMLLKIETLTLLGIWRREHVPTSMVELCNLKHLELDFHCELPVEKSVEFVEFLVDLFKQPDCFSHLKSIDLCGRKGFLGSYKWSGHILDRQQQGLLTVNIHESEYPTNYY